MKSSNTVFVKQFSDGWGLLYPDPGFIDCGPDCRGCGGKQAERKLIESHSRFPTPQDAMEEAVELGFKDIKVQKGKS